MHHAYSLTSPAVALHCRSCPVHLHDMQRIMNATGRLGSALSLESGEAASECALFMVVVLFTKSLSLESGEAASECKL